MINDRICAELKRTQEAYKTDKQKEIELKECWNQFFKPYKDSIVQTDRSFVSNAIEQICEQ